MIEQNLNNNKLEKSQQLIKILEDGIKNKNDIELLKSLGQYFASNSDKEKIKSTQLRKFFGAIKKIQFDFDNKKSEIVLLLPKLAYTVGRNKGSKLRDLFDLIEPLILAINEDREKFKNFVNIFEAIVAYHKEEDE